MNLSTAPIYKLINKIENSPAPLTYFILTFLSFATLRNFLEAILPPSKGTLLKFSYLLEQFSHYYLWYISLALVLILFFYFLTKEKIEKITKVVLLGFFLIILGPIIDVFWSGGTGFGINYCPPEQLIKSKDYLTAFLTIGGNLEYSEGLEAGSRVGFGVTPGMRIEIIIAVFLSFFYLKLKTKNIKKSLLGAFLFYSLLGPFAAIPTALKLIFDFFSIDYEPSAEIFRNYLFFTSLILFFLVLLFRNKKEMLALIKSIKPLRLLSFELMFILGMILAKPNFKNLLLDQDRIFYFIFYLIGIALSWLFMVIVDNLEDTEEDKGDEKKKLPGDISPENYKKIPYFLAGLGVIFGTILGFRAYFLALVAIAAGFLYSAPPLKLKNVVFFSKVLTAFVFLVILIVGYDFAGGNIRYFPKEVAIFLLIPFAACANFTDLKDYEAEKKLGIKTLPVILGMEKSKILIGFFFLVSYIILPFLLNLQKLQLWSIFFGVLSFAVLIRKKYEEKLVFFVFLLSLLPLAFYLLKR